MVDIANMPAQAGLQVYDGDERRGYDGYCGKDATALATYHVSDRVAGENREVRLELGRKADLTTRELADMQRESFRNFDEIKRLIIEKANDNEKFMRDNEIQRLRDAVLKLELKPTAVVK